MNNKKSMVRNIIVNHTVMRLNRARMTNTLLEELVFLKCNAF